MVYIKINYSVTDVYISGNGDAPVYIKVGSGDGGGSGTVTSVDMTVPTGLTVSGNPITSSGTLAVSYASGYSIPTTAKQGEWDQAYNDKINSAAVTGTTTKTLTLNQQDGGTITASWSDLNTDSVTSVFGRTGAVTAAEGDYTLTQLGDVTISSPTNGQVLKYNGTTWVNNTDTDTGLTSVGLTMPSAFTVSNSPLTSNGTIAVTGAGTASQYIRGDGQLGDFPQGGGGGGASVSYYLNGSVNQGTFVGNTYYEMNKNAIIGAGSDFSIGSNGYIAQFITDANDPNLLIIPAGNWNLEFYFSASSGGGNPNFYAELYKYDGTNFTLIASGSTSPELIAFGTTINPYFTALAVPETVLTATDRLAIRIYVNTSGRTITLHTENSHLCQIVTTFTTGLTALNGLTKQVQFFATGSSGTDFNISSVTDTHTFNLPTASATNRGALSSADWTTFNNKENVLSFSSPLSRSVNTVSIPQANSTTNGFLSSTDWTTFNNKQNALTNPITGSAASGQVAYFTGATTQAGSNNLFWDATNNRLGIGTNAPSWTHDVRYFDNAFNGGIRIQNTNTGTSSLVGISLFNTAGTRVGNFQYIPSNFAADPSQQNTVTFTSEGSQKLAFIANAAGGSPQDIYFKTSAGSNNAMYIFGTTRNINIGGSTDSGQRLQVNGTALFTGSVTGIGNSSTYTVTASSGSAVSKSITSTLVAAANNDTLVGLDVSPTFTNGAFTGVSNLAARFQDDVILTKNKNSILTFELYNPSVTTSATELKLGNISRVLYIGKNNGNTLAGRGINTNTIGTNDSYILSNFGGDLALVNQNGNIKFAASGTTLHAQFFSSTGNLLLQNGGTFTDSGQRLQVQGDAFIRGSGATSATTALAIQNSGSTPLFSVRNDGYVLIGSGNSGTPLASLLDVRGGADADYMQVARVTSSSTRYVRLYADGRIYALTTSTAQPAFTFEGVANTQISGPFGLFTITGAFSPTSGTATYANFQITQTVNQTGGANGITRGIYVTPTLTAAADWRSIEWSNNTGWGLYGAGTAANYLNGNLGLRTTVAAGPNGGGLAIYETDYPRLSFRNSTTGDTNNVGMQMYMVTNNFYYDIKGNNRQIFVTNGTERIHLFGSGNLLLQNGGTFTDAGFRLDVNGTARVQGALTGSGVISAATNFRLNNQGFSQVAILDAGGSFAGGYNLTLSGTTPQHNSTGAISGYYYGSGGTIRFYADSSQTAGTNATERMRITAAGRLLLGTTTESTFLLDVNGTARVQGGTQITGTATTDALRISTNVSASSGFGYLGNFIGTLTATANNDDLTAININPTWSVGAFTGTLQNAIKAAGTIRISSASSVNWRYIIGHATTAFLTSTYEGGLYGTTDAAGAYPYNGNGHVVLQGRSTADRDILIVNGATPTTQMVFFGSSKNVAIGTTTDVASAVLNVASTTKGFLPPRMTGAQAEAIATPADGLMVYINNGNGTTITSTGFWGRDAGAWVKLN